MHASQQAIIYNQNTLAHTIAMDSNQVRLHDSDGMIVNSDSLATDALSHTFLTEDYMPQDDLDGTGMQKNILSILCCEYLYYFLRVFRHRQL